MSKQKITIRELINKFKDTVDIDIIDLYYGIYDDGSNFSDTEFISFNDINEIPKILESVNINMYEIFVKDFKCTLKLHIGIPAENLVLSDNNGLPDDEDIINTMMSNGVYSNDYISMISREAIGVLSALKAINIQDIKLSIILNYLTYNRHYQIRSLLYFYSLKKWISINNTDDIDKYILNTDQSIEGLQNVAFYIYRFINFLNNFISIESNYKNSSLIMNYINLFTQIVENLPNDIDGNMVASIYCVIVNIYNHIHMDSIIDICKFLNN